MPILRMGKLRSDHLSSWGHKAGRGGAKIETKLYGFIACAPDLTLLPTQFSKTQTHYLL